MVRSLARGQFRVTSGWTERAIASGPVPVVVGVGRHAGSPDDTSEAPTEAWPLYSQTRQFTLARPRAFPPGPVRSPRVTPFVPPVVEAPPSPVLEEPRPEVVTPVTALDLYRAGPLSRAEVAAERAVARGPFRVTFAWAEKVRPSPAPLVEPKVEPPPVPPPPVLAAAPIAVPEPEPPKEEAAPEPTASPPAEPPPTASAPAGNGLDEARRTLVSLLARMWLLRTTASAPAGVALPSPVPSTVPLGPPPLPTVPPVSSEPPSPAAKPAQTVPPAPLEPPSPAPTPPQSLPPVPAEPPSPGPLPGPAERPLPRPADLDDRRPLSGVATFLVEVADVVRTPPRPEPAPPPGFERALLPARPYHCHNPGAHRQVSRDACRQFRVGR